jgi:hypothetical protein
MTALEHQIDQLVAAWRRIHAVDPQSAELQLQLVEAMAFRLENPAAAAERSRQALERLAARNREESRTEWLANAPQRDRELLDAMACWSTSRLRKVAGFHRVPGRSKMSRSRLLAAVRQATVKDWRAQRAQRETEESRANLAGISKYVDMGIVRVQPPGVHQ